MALLDHRGSRGSSNSGWSQESLLIIHWLNMSLVSTHFCYKHSQFKCLLWRRSCTGSWVTGHLTQWFRNIPLSRIPLSRFCSARTSPAGDKHVIDLLVISTWSPRSFMIGRVNTTSSIRSASGIFQKEWTYTAFDTILVTCGTPQADGLEI